MACGVGACLGCVVKVRSQKSEVRSQNNWTYKRVCKEGPVFDIKDIIWE
jgi:dihydroorotate dehydrogenase electron transfer subunit